MTTTATQTRTFAGDLIATWNNTTGLWTVTRAGAVLGTVAEDFEGFSVHPVAWPHPDGSGNRPSLSAAVRALRHRADNPLTAPADQEQASKLASLLVRDLGHSPRTDYRGTVLSTRIEICPNCTQQMRDVLDACALVESAVVVPGGPNGARMFVTWHAPA